MRAAGRIPVVVGGTGFYVTALVEPLFAAPPLDPRRRTELAAELAPLTTDELRREVERVDPRARAPRARRSCCARSSSRASPGEPISELARARPARRAGIARGILWWIRARCSRERIAERVERMLAQGWEEEVAALAQRCPRTRRRGTPPATR